MKHYVNATGEIFAYEEDGSQDHLIGDKTPLTNAEADALRAEQAAAAFNAKPYADKRKNKYPEIGDQLDALFHAGVFPAEMAAKIQAVKDQYPKG
jgi:hypothetical protein